MHARLQRDAFVLNQYQWQIRVAVSICGIVNVSPDRGLAMQYAGHFVNPTPEFRQRQLLARMDRPRQIPVSKMVVDGARVRIAFPGLDLGALGRVPTGSCLPNLLEVSLVQSRVEVHLHGSSANAVAPSDFFVRLIPRKALIQELAFFSSQRLTARKTEEGLRHANTTLGIFLSVATARKKTILSHRVTP